MQRAFRDSIGNRPHLSAKMTVFDHFWPIFRHLQLTQGQSIINNFMYVADCMIARFLRLHFA